MERDAVDARSSQPRQFELIKLSEKMRLMLDSMQADLDAMDALINDAQSIIKEREQAEQKWLEEYSAWAD